MIRRSRASTATPKGRGKDLYPAQKDRSCHPLLAFDGATKEVLHSWWRTEEAYTGNGAAEFFTETCQRLPNPQGRRVVRADSGFFSDP